MKKLRKNLFQTMKFSSQNPFILNKNSRGIWEKQRSVYPHRVDKIETFGWVDEETFEVSRFIDKIEEFQRKSKCVKGCG